MGVIKHNPNLFSEYIESANVEPGRLSPVLPPNDQLENDEEMALRLQGEEIELFYAQNDPVSDDDVTERAAERQKPSRRTRRRVVIHSPVRPEPTTPLPKSRGRKNSGGGKKFRRYENINQLMKWVDDENDLNEITIYDFMPRSMSAFAQILSETVNMKMWNDYIRDCEEMEDTEKYTETKSKATVAPASEQNDNSESSSEGGSSDGSAIPSHPAFSPEMCFRRVDAKLRAMLKEKHMPMETLRYLEAEVTNFFRQSPKSVYVFTLPSAFDRMLLHAVCQYLDLVSKSFDASGLRKTRVRNRRHVFQPPSLSLVSYIDRKNGGGS